MNPNKMVYFGRGNASIKEQMKKVGNCNNNVKGLGQDSKKVNAIVAV